MFHSTYNALSLENQCAIVKGWDVTEDYANETVRITGSEGGFSLSNCPDREPAMFSFTSTFDQELNATVDSNQVQISEIDDATPISIDGGEYQINDGNWTSQKGLVNNGDRVSVRVVASQAYETTTTAKLKVGTVCEKFAFSTTTRSAPVSSSSEASSEEASSTSSEASSEESSSSEASSEESSSSEASSEASSEQSSSASSQESLSAPTGKISSTTQDDFIYWSIEWLNSNAKSLLVKLVHELKVIKRVKSTNSNIDALTCSVDGVEVENLCSIDENGYLVLNGIIEPSSVVSISFRTPLDSTIESVDMSATGYYDENGDGALDSGEATLSLSNNNYTATVENPVSASSSSSSSTAATQQEIAIPLLDNFARLMLIFGFFGFALLFLRRVK